MEEYGVKDFEELSLDQLWDLFIDFNICSEESLQLVTNINGYNYDAFKDILYATFGLRNLEQLVEEFDITPDDYPELFTEQYQGSSDGWSIPESDWLKSESEDFR